METSQTLHWRYVANKVSQIPRNAPVKIYISMWLLLNTANLAVILIANYCIMFCEPGLQNSRPYFRIACLAD